MPPDYMNSFNRWGRGSALDSLTQNYINPANYSSSGVQTAPMRQNPGQGMFTGMQRWFGGTAVGPNGAEQSTPGIVPSALSTVGGLANLYLGMKSYGLAKDDLSQRKKEFNMNYAANRNMTNAQLEGRYRGLIASNPSGYESVGDYMKKYGVK